MTKYLITRQNADGTYDSAGMNNRMIVSDYKTYRNAFKYAINPFGRGRMCQVEVYHGSIQAPKPHNTFYTVTF